MRGTSRERSSRQKHFHHWPMRDYALAMAGEDTDVEIRFASVSDADAVTKLANAFHAEDGHPLSDRGRAALVALLEPLHRYGCVLVLVIQDAICGYGALSFGYSIEYGGRDAFVDDLYVVPEFRAKRHGTRLIERLQCEAQRMGCCALHVEVLPGNRAAHWYRRIGYSDRGSSLMTKAY